MEHRDGGIYRKKCHSSGRSVQGSKMKVTEQSPWFSGEFAARVKRLLRTCLEPTAGESDGKASPKTPEAPPVAGNGPPVPEQRRGRGGCGRVEATVLIICSTAPV